MSRTHRPPTTPFSSFTADIPGHLGPTSDSTLHQTPHSYHSRLISSAESGVCAAQSQQQADRTATSHVSSQRMTEWHVEPKYAFRIVRIVPQSLTNNKRESRRRKRRAHDRKVYSPCDYIRSDSRPALPARGPPSSRALL